MNTQTSPNDLGEFLRARRSELDPTQVGLPADAGRARRVAGLRREEVAMLAGISVDYYTRLEQGRLSPSKSALAAVARSLRLREDDLDYLYRLARLGRTPVDQHRRQTVGPQTHRCWTACRASRRWSSAATWMCWRGIGWPRRCMSTSPRYRSNSAT
ncbi:helix-turn-helix domain-containing protein [Pseudomonas sp. HMWF021]|uniref:helix-turn-helix domain-containing protein n=1 Tax=Pseudomonas sp. HMWF021 TaxID=2056857 RepID=UPI001C47EF7F|nr:helix-turn-helix transcriptional regulator [Pseudomonas sp. HMWF021]